MNKKRNEEFENIIKNNINNLFIKSKKNKKKMDDEPEEKNLYDLIDMMYDSKE